MINNNNYSANENANFGLNMESISGQNSSSRNITTNNLIIMTTLMELIMPKLIIMVI